MRYTSLCFRRIAIWSPHTDMRTIRGKKVLITGAAGGIGRALAMRFAQEQADLYLTDIDNNRLQEVISAVHAHGIAAWGACCDLTQSAEITLLNQQILNEWNGVDVLVNNAGVCYYGPTLQMTDQQWNWLLAINLHAPAQFVRELLPTLLSRPEAHILNVCSLYAFAGTARCSAYHLTKFGLLGFTEALRAEFGRRGLGVTAVCPGFVATKLYESMASGEESQKTRVPPKWVTSTPEQVADKALRALYRDRRLALIGWPSYALYYLKRFAPGLIDSVQRIGRRGKMKRTAAQLALPATTTGAETTPVHSKAA